MCARDLRRDGFEKLPVALYRLVGFSLKSLSG